MSAEHSVFSYCVCESFKEWSGSQERKKMPKPEWRLFRLQGPVPPLLVAFQMESCEPHLGKKRDAVIRAGCLPRDALSLYKHPSYLRRGSCTYVSWGAVPTPSQGSSGCWIVLLWEKTIFFLPWFFRITYGLVMASCPDVIHMVSGDPYYGYSYFTLRLIVSHRFPMLLACWRLPLCSLYCLSKVWFSGGVWFVFFFL